MYGQKASGIGAQRPQRAQRLFVAANAEGPTPPVANRSQPPKPELRPLGAPPGTGAPPPPPGARAPTAPGVPPTMAAPPRPPGPPGAGAAPPMPPRPANGAPMAPPRPPGGPGASPQLGGPPTMARPGPPAPPGAAPPGAMPPRPPGPSRPPPATGAPPSLGAPPAMRPLPGAPAQPGMTALPPRPPAAAGGAAAPPTLAPPPAMGRPPMPQQPAAPPAMPRPAAPGGLAPPPAMPRPGAPAPPGMPQRPGMPMARPSMPPPPAAAGSGMQTLELRRPVAPPPAAPGAAKPQPPQPRGGEEQQQGVPGAKKAVMGRLGEVEVVEEEDDELAALMVDDDDEEEGGAAKKGAKDKKGKKGGRKEKVTAEMKRAARKQREAEREEKAAKQRREKEEIFEVGEEGMSLEALAEAIQVDASDIVRSLFMKGIMLSMNQVLDRNTVKLVAGEYDLLVVDKEDEGPTSAARKSSEWLDIEDLDEAVPRPPVVTVMGHVDHGKTSLLDYIRKAKVAAGEAGGITQSIGAYNVDVQLEGEYKTICFLDTPGHEAFSAMRARGARVTDIAVIIVAADDGVQPQTKEAVSHAQAAEVPIIVAINKIDKPGADPDRAKQGLLELGLVPEEWGGNTPMVNVSAKKGTGVEDLLQMLAWVAEEKGYVAAPNKLAAGTVIEAHLDRKRGAVATLLVQAGTLRIGDVVAAGASVGKVRSLNNAAGSSIPEAGPSIAVQMVGLGSVPMAGDEFHVYPSDADARAAAAEAEAGLRQARLADMTASGSMVTLSSLATYDEEGGQDVQQRMNLIIKGDTSGVVEAIRGALSALPQDVVVLRYLLCAAGEITPSDVDLAAASGGMVLGFNLEPEESVLSHAKRLGVTINTYRVIYNLIDDVKAAMEGKLRQVEERVPMGSAKVKAVFGSGKKRVAGCEVLEGKLVKGSTVEIKRGKEVVHKGALESLRRVKDTVDEVAAGLECGVGVEGFTQWNEGDSIDCFMVVTKSQRLEEAKAASIDVSALEV